MRKVNAMCGVTNERHIQGVQQLKKVSVEYNIHTINMQLATDWSGSLPSLLQNMTFIRVK